MTTTGTYTRTDGTTATWSDSPRSWEIRDRDVADLIDLYRAGRDWPERNAAAAQAASYIGLAARAGQDDRARQWALDLAEAEDAAPSQ